MVTLIRLGHFRRYTANRTAYLDIGRDKQFLKLIPNRAEAIAEVAGHARLCPHYPVPTLRGRYRLGRWTLLTYDRVGGTTSPRLLLDEINDADRTGDPARLDRCLDDILGRYHGVITANTERRPLRTTITKLYGDRAAAGGRLDHYYGDNRPLLTVSGRSLQPDDLARTVLVVNGAPYRIDFHHVVAALRSRFAEGEVDWAAITQGDPTDLNIAWHPGRGPTWFDYDTGGWNALAGEFACFLWYQWLHGGWIVPTYNPAAFADHPDAIQARIRNRPNVRVDWAGDRLVIEYAHTPSPARQHTIGRYLHEFIRPTTEQLEINDLTAWLRPWLATRILGVFRIGDLRTEDAALHLAYLARLLDPDSRLDELLQLPVTRSAS